MNLIQWSVLYFGFNVLLAVAFFMLFAMRSVRVQLNERQWLRLHYASLSLVALVVITVPFVPRSHLVGPIVKVWEPLPSRQNQIMIAPTPTMAVGEWRGALPSRQTQSWILLVALLAGVAVALQLASALLRLRRLKRHAYCLRKLGRVSIYTNSEIKIPMSFWVPGQACVFLPETMVATQEEFRIAVLHELQHHRQRDTRWVYPLFLLRRICIVNPALHLWTQWIFETQEFACDEALVDQKGVESQAYARCLIKAALQAFAEGVQPVCATGMIFSRDRQLLTRRIEQMINTRPKSYRGIFVGYFLLTAAAVTLTAFTSTGLVQDRRVSLQQAQDMAKAAQNPQGVQLAVNERVLKWLNYFQGTPDGRKQMHAGLQRLETYRSVVTEKLKYYGVPEELMAVPLVESGYENLPESHRHGVGAGLWMFIPSTARHFGLRVDDQADQRLDVKLETDAAMRYLLANKLRFSDWSLALMAYNVGESSVESGIEHLHSRDPWTLIHNGIENDTDYLAKVTAAILIMKNPSSVE